eukprot:6478383-Amphidinium_carterae.1
MFGKRTRFKSNAKATPAKRLRTNIKDLWASSSISAGRTQSLVQDIDACGVHSFDSMPSCGKARQVANHFRKEFHWPNTFAWPIPCRGNSGDEVQQVVNFMLPHEVVSTMNIMSEPGALLESEGLDATCYQHLLQ